MANLTGWDDAFYVSQLTSAIGDRDLLLQNDLLAFPQPLAERLRSITTTFDSGAVQNTFSVGFAVLHGVYTWPFLALTRHPSLGVLRRVLTAGSLAILILTALAMVRLCEAWGFGRQTSRLATSVALVSSPLAVFGTRAYLNAHLLGALLAAMVLLGIDRALDADSAANALLAGLAAGLLVINRWQDAALLAAALPVIATAIRAADGLRMVALLRALGIATVAFAGATSLQLLAWHAQFSTWLLLPQGTGYVHWASPRLLPLLTSAYHGLLPWAPGLAIGIALAPFGRRPNEGTRVRAWRRGFLLAVPLSIYVSATPSDWWAGDSYGPRRLATLVPIAALGLAALLEAMTPWARALTAGVLTCWAILTVSAYSSGFDDLHVLFLRTPDRFNPKPGSACAGAHWIDSWGPFHALKPGFSFSDAPSARDRLAGALFCALLITATNLAWAHLSRSRSARKALTTAAVVWVVVCAFFLAFAVPLNGDRNLRWRAVVRDESEPAHSRAFPPSVAEAAEFVRAAHALAASDDAAFRDHWRRASLRDRFGITEEAMRAAFPAVRTSVPAKIP